MTAPTSFRPLRADARRNRECVVTAATECVAEAGMTAQMEDVARRAGVGVGTVYRHFATKDDLLLAVARHKFDRFTELAERIERERPAGEAFERYVWALADLQADDRVLCEIAGEMPATMVRRDPQMVEGLERVVGRMIAHAQAAGTLREDFSVRDMPLLGCTISHAITMGPQVPGGDWRCLVTLLVDGLRPPAPR